MKTLIALLCLSIFALPGFSQKDKKTDTLSGDAVKQLLQQITDSSRLLRETAGEACNCIDSINTAQKGHKAISEEIAKCIEKQAEGYQLAIKLLKSFTGEEKDRTISLNINSNSAEYKRYYYEIERFLNDSCSAFKKAAASNNEESDFSTSGNPKALEAYNEGVVKMQAEQYKEAIKFFEKAVSIDEKFAFAWDNIGICFRKTAQYEEALKAYKKSLEIDPKGKTPLQNIPVVYSYMKNYDEAIRAYENLAAIHPGDPETFYGIGNIYTYAKPDMEKALHNMCKAYNLYVEQKSPYRTDAENSISYIFGQMKKAGKESEFYKILEEYHIKPSSK